MGERFFDTVHRVESPEGIVLELHPAGPYVRLFAWLVDGAIRSAAVLILLVAAALLEEFGQGLFAIAFFALNWLYPVVFELFAGGATPGKRLFGLQVVKLNGTPVDLAASLIRNLLRVVDYLPVFFVLGLVSMLASRGFRRIGDLAAGTLVVYGRGSTIPGLWRAAVPAIQPVVPAVSLDFSEQRALVGFAGRAAFLGPARAKELAELVAPAVDHRPAAAADPVSSLVGAAAWITGRRT